MTAPVGLPGELLSAALAPLSDAWTAYRDRLQQLMLIGNRLNKGQAELPQLEQRLQQAAVRLALVLEHSFNPETQSN